MFHKMTKRTKPKVIPKENHRCSMISIPHPVQSVDVAVDIDDFDIHVLIGFVEAMTNAKKLHNEVFPKLKLNSFSSQTRINSYHS